MDNWKNIWTTESENATFDFVNHEGVQQIDLHFIPGDTFVSTLRLTYEQWEELCQMVHRIAPK